MSEAVAISVIMSTRNRARYLPDALSTLAAQQCDVPFEVIVIDNGSTDSTPAIVEAWCRSNQRFRTAREPRAGLSRGKNAGIRLARAPLLLFIDDDMGVDAHWIRSEEHTSELQSLAYLVCRLLLEKKKNKEN